MRIHFIRHTRPLIDAGVCYGQSDVPLAPSYLYDRVELSKKLRHQYDYVYSSPLLRCQVLAKSLGCSEITLDDRLLEYNFGDWELQPWSELTCEHAKQWFNDYVTTVPPKGESLIEMNSRVLDFFDQLVKQHQAGNKTIAVVCHAGVLRLIVNYILGGELKNTPFLKLDYGAVIEVIKMSPNTNPTVQFL